METMKTASPSVDQAEPSSMLPGESATPAAPSLPSTNRPPPRALPRLPLIDVLRALAALMVLVYHVLQHAEWATFPNAGVLRIFQMGWIGVDLFFVISGFVIGLSAMQGAASGDPFWRRSFAERRLRRILPLYLLTGTVYLFLVDPQPLLHGAKTAAVHIGTHLLFIHNLFYRTYDSINAPSWSIGVEMQFYLLMALLAGWLLRTSIWRIVLTGIGVALLWRWGTTLALPPGESIVGKQLISASQLPAVLDAFVLGIALAKLALAGKLAPGWGRAALAGALGVLLLTAASEIYWPRSAYWNSTAMIVWWRLLVACGSVALLAALVMCPVREGGWLLRLTWPLRFLGVISYGLYLWHLGVMYTLLQTTPWRGADLLVGVLGGTIALATLSWYGFEKIWLKAAPKGVLPQAPRSF